ncbi:MAG: hypothetical protein M1833_005266 [Piccolia ochrophora]|nr:MAG: hypothetical protein M1833_005266 [Piccolia ochrophora]
MTASLQDEQTVLEVSATPSQKYLEDPPAQEESPPQAGHDREGRDDSSIHLTVGAINTTPLTNGSDVAPAEHSSALSTRVNGHEEGLATTAAATTLDTVISSEQAAASLAEHQRALDAILSGASSSGAAYTFEEPTAPPLALESTPSLPVPLGLDTMLASQHAHVGQDVDGPQIRAFAKLEFDDGPFYMNTYCVELGRDIRAARLASEPEGEPRKRSKGKSRRKSSSTGDGSQGPAQGKGEDAAKSVVSESGGIMGVDTPSDTEGTKRRNRRKSQNSQITSSSSQQQLSRKNSCSHPVAPPIYFPQGINSMSHRTSGAHPVDPLSLLPSPDECPLIPIHPPAVAVGKGGHKGISRKHVKIAYNFEKHLFELHIRGRNGAFVDERWHASGETMPLNSGSFIQIGGVGLRFVLPDVAGEDTQGEGTEASSALGERMFLEGDEGFDELDSDDIADEADGEGGLTSTSELEETKAESEDEELEPTPPPPPVPVKRGPGRPPKNGISKRQMQQQEAERKAKLAGKKFEPAVPRVKGKVGRPRKNSKPEDPEQKPQKRKYTKRKSLDAGKDGKSDGVNGLQGSEKKEKKPPKPPRSPSPVFDESKLSAEDLQKPQSSYVVLIHEAISNSKAGAMSLPQIYRAIERKYPYYKLRVTTTGWQSSVRHNLSQHHAFRKVERDGKGWMWGIVPGISIEKEKKRRPSPPPMPPQSQHRLAGGPPHFNVSAAPMRMGAPIGSMGPPSTLQPYQQPPTVSGPPSYQSPYATPSTSGPQNGQTHIQPQQQQPPPHHIPSPTTRFPDPSPPTTLHSPAQPPQQQPPTTRPAPSHQSRPSTPALSQDIIKAVQSFKTALIKSMPATKHSEAVVQSAVNRVLGLADKTTAPLPSGKEDGQEATIMKALGTIISKFTSTGGGATAASSSSTAAAVVTAAAQTPGKPTPPPAAPRLHQQAPTAPMKPQPTPAPKQQQQQHQPGAPNQLLHFLQQIGKRPPPSPSPGSASPAPPHASTTSQAQKQGQAQPPSPSSATPQPTTSTPAPAAAPSSSPSKADKAKDENLPPPAPRGVKRGLPDDDSSNNNGHVELRTSPRATRSREAKRLAT